MIVRRAGTRTALGAAAVLLAACAGPAAQRDGGDVDYVAEIEQFRAQREERLQAEDGWLSLIGLHWLEPGENGFGSDAANAVVFDVPEVASHAGVLFVDDEGVLLRAPEESGVTLGGERLTERRLTDDSQGRPDMLEIGRLKFYVIKRSDRYAVRAKHPDNPSRQAFAGLDYFEVDPAYRVEGTLRRYPEPRQVEVATVVEMPTRMLVPGTLELTLDGEKVTLQPFVGAPDATEVFLIFKDATSGHETYGAGRYLYATLDGDTVDVDFNRAYNPPCAFTPFATCPLPPPENWLQARIEAGEKAYAHY